MSAGISSIAIFAPIAASNAVFSIRRASRGVDSIYENPGYASMNMLVAAGQVSKGTQAVMNMTKTANSGLPTTISGAADTIKISNKLLKGAGKVVNFTADHINPVICLTSGIKVLGSDDKVDTAARESLALISMFGMERLAKSALGMPFTKKVNGQLRSFTRKSLADRNPFIKQQIKALTDYCATKKLFNKVSLKALPPVLKGLAFVTASILGYKLGNALADAILGKAEDKKNKKTLASDNLENKKVA